LTWSGTGQAFAMLPTVNPGPRVGLALGAGGVTGAAYLAGALAALENDLGWDARGADAIVGTSAGALIGALLRSGVPAGDLAAWTVRSRLSDEGAAVLAALERPEFDAVRLRQFLHPLRVPRPQAVWSALRNARRFDPLRALMIHLHDGTRDVQSGLAFLGAGWPEQSFACCAVRRSDGRRRVFGPPQVPSDGLAAAVAASCAVPGYFAPVEVDGGIYLDGGIASSTNAEVLPDGIDLAIVFAPMASAEPQNGFSLDRLVRDRTRSRLRHELSQLSARGIESLVFAPGPQTIARLGHDFMSDAAAAEIVVSSFLETGEQLHRSGLADRLGARRCVA
jgi:NTE family protein